MSNIYLLWHLTPQKSPSRWIVIKTDGRTISWSTQQECLTWLNTVDESVVYTNSQTISLGEQQEGLSLYKFDLTTLEYHYLFNLIEAWIPDLDDPSSVLSHDIKHQSEKKFKPLIEWLVRFHRHFMGILEVLHPYYEKKKPPAETYQKMASWLSRRYSRLYPEGTVMDKHVYCARWASTHWSERLKSGFAHVPHRDSGMLKACRTEPSRALLIDQAAFMLVNFSKTSVPLDFPLKQSVWVSNAELNAIALADPKTKYEIEDLLVFPVEKLPKETIVTDDTLVLSISHGLALRQSLSFFENSWEMAWWRSLERANWCSLINDVSKSHEIVVSGYGDGYLSFYCWSGEMAKLTELLRMKASVLKHSDQDFDAEFQQEYRSLLANEYSMNIDMDQENDKPNHTQSTI